MNTEIAARERRSTIAAAGAGPDLDIGLIYTGERQFMDPLVDSLAQSAPGLATRLILIDNASREGTAAWEDRFPRVTTLRNASPLGYAPNLNRVLAASTAPFILLLNTDMVFDPREACLAKMVEFMRRRPDCGVSTCGIFRADGSFAHPARGRQTLAVIAARRLGIRWPGSRVLERYLNSDRDPGETFACDWISGCFMLLRRQAIDEIGDFDCRFGKYFEDVDLCRRLRRADWSVMYHGATRCTHFEQRASRRVLSRDGWRHARAYAHWVHKWGLFD